MRASPDNFPLLAELLAEQQRLQTPVARFAEHHASTPTLAPVYRDLIPLSAPGPGGQYAFEVDLDACSGCKACVAGCHSLNGLDEHETWRDVGVVFGTDGAHPFQQTITSACHHCADPGCLNGCPVLAYEKDPLTGIVKHLDDQCIGCSYCILKCPYDVPKFNARLGIVRKCDLCQGRLAAGEAPACVQACPTQAIRVVHVATATAGDAFLPAAVAPAADYTRPTTRYVSKHPLPAALTTGDAGALRVQPTHTALVLLLVLSQAGLGLLTATAVGRWLERPAPGWLPGVGLALLAIGLVASVAHLGQPLRAWRVVLGLRRSWLSREAVLLGAAIAPLALFGVAPWIPALAPLATAALVAGVGLGALAIACSALLYIDTRRRFWATGPTTLRMGGTWLVALCVGLAPLLAAAVLLGKLLGEAATLRGDGVSARLQRGPLRRWVVARFTLGLTALLALALPGTPPWLGLTLVVLGELGERVLFFRAVDAPKMPGVPAGGTQRAHGHA